MTSPMTDPVKLLENILPELVPSIAALSISSLTILVANSFNHANKLLFQSCIFAAAIAASVTYLVLNIDQTSSFWNGFLGSSQEIRFCLSILVISMTYFGGAMYLASPEHELESHVSNATPASIDISIGFDIPEALEKDDKEFFVESLDKICNEIISDLPTTYEMPDEAVEWIDSMLKYNVAGGKMNRGLSTVSVVRTFFNEAGKKFSDKERSQAVALGWCVEFLQAFFLVADDIMDDSVTRRGQPCWFRQENVKMIAINDSFILESCVYKILKRYFGEETYYLQLVDLFIEVTRQTELGQLLDLTSQKLDGTIDLTRFTMQRYSSIVKYKTAFYSFYLPVALGMIVSGISDRHLFDKAREILLIMGEYFQIQDDYLDCYGKPEQIGKVGTDIQDNKCSWLVVQALKLANESQRKVLEKNYGRNTPKNINKIKDLYADLDLEQLFFSYEEESYRKIQGLLDETKELPREVFEFLLKKIYKRSK